MPAFTAWAARCRATHVARNRVLGAAWRGQLVYDRRDFAEFEQVLADRLKFTPGPGVGTSSGSVISVFGGGPRKIRRPLQSEQLPASRGRPAVACSRILHHEPKPAVGDEIPHA